MTTVAVNAPILSELALNPNLARRARSGTAAGKGEHILWEAGTVIQARVGQAEQIDHAKHTDEDLITAMCEGQEWAIETLHDRYFRYTYALAYRIVHDPVIAEDIVQEAFLSIWRKASSYSAECGNVRGWLQAIVHHRAIDKIREARHRTQQWVPLQVDNEQDPACEQPDVWEKAWQDEQQRMIRAALWQLPAEQRRVIELAYFGGYTHVEIAEQCEVPLGTIKGRMRLGLQKMRVILQEQGIQ